MYKINFLKKNKAIDALLLFIIFFSSSLLFSQTLPYEVVNRSEYNDNEVYIGIVGITGGHVWVDPVTGQVNPMRQSDNTVQGPVIDGNQGPGNNGLYANCFRRLSDIPNKTINIPKIAGCRIMIAFKSQLYLYFFGYDGAPSGYSAPNLANPTDPNQGIKYELIELTFNDFGLWCNTTRVDSYQYPMGLEVWGNNFYKKVGELKTHQQIIADWQNSAPAEFQPLLNTNEGIIHFPTKTTSFPTNFLQSYIDAIWSKYSSQQLVFNSGQAGIWRGSVVGGQFRFTRDSDGQVATIPGKPTTVDAMEGSGVLASGGQWDKVVQAQFVAAITRHAINLNTPSGVLQNFGDTNSYYNTWPYNWYSKFWHRKDISFDGQTYAFAYDDVFDQSATIHTPSPNRIKITIGGFAGLNNPGSGPVTVFQHCNYGGYSAKLEVGSYTLSQLQALGIQNNDISSIQLEPGYQATLYQNNNFTGNSIVVTASDTCLVNEGFNDQMSSIVIAEAGNTWSTRIEAEDYALMNGIQTEPCNEGGLNVGYIDAGDWMVWDVNIPSSGVYTISYRVASQNGGGTIQFEKAGGNPIYGSLQVPSTSGWQNWTTISHQVNLEGGQQQIAIYAPAGGYNINWLDIHSGSSKSEQVKAPVITDSFNVYPTIVEDELYISNITGTQFLVFDMKGKLVRQINNQSKSKRMEVNISELPKGIYIVKEVGTGTINRFIKN